MFKDNLLKLENNLYIKNNIDKYNYERELIGDEIYPNLGLKYIYIIEDKVLLLMFCLGIPVGIIHSTDEKGNYVSEDMEPIGEVKHIYKPLKHISDYWDFYNENDGFVDLRVHPDFLPKQKINHLAYCLGFANNTDLFDSETMNKMQNEIIDSCPLNYDNAMKIFNKYYNDDIQKKFIFDYGVSIDSFYELSGLNKIDIGNIEIYNNIKI